MLWVYSGGSVLVTDRGIVIHFALGADAVVGVWPMADYESIPTVLFEHCACTRYDADPERRVVTPAQTV